MNRSSALVAFSALSTVALCATLVSGQTPTKQGAKPAAPAAQAPAHATATMPTVSEEKPGLYAKSKITSEAATHTALARVPGGTVHKGVLEEEDGKLIYSFEIKVPGKSGIEEVNVDAKSGKVVSVEHETDAQIAAEAAKEAKAATAAAAKRPAAPATKKP